MGGGKLQWSVQIELWCSTHSMVLDQKLQVLQRDGESFLCAPQEPNEATPSIEGCYLEFPQLYLHSTSRFWQQKLALPVAVITTGI